MICQNPPKAAFQEALLLSALQDIQITTLDRGKRLPGVSDGQ